MQQRAATAQTAASDDSTSIALISSWCPASVVSAAEADAPDPRQIVAGDWASPCEVDHAPTTSSSARPSAVTILAASARSTRLRGAGSDDRGDMTREV